VRRPVSVETTAIGAATIAGLAVGLVTLDELEGSWEQDAAFDPEDATFLDAAYDAWIDAVGRVRTLAAQGARES
jgi:glycerol kinase